MRRSKDQCIYLQNSWIEHGENSFNIVIIEECDINLISAREQYFIELLNTKRPNGYNLTDGGDGSIGYEHTPETLGKLKLFNANFGEKNGRSKLTEENVFEILYDYYFNGKTTVDLGREYDVSNAMIGFIIRWENWKTIFSRFMNDNNNPSRPEYIKLNHDGENNGRALLLEKCI